MGRIVKLAYPHHQALDGVCNGELPPVSPFGATFHILEGYCQGTLADYQRLAQMLKDEFPEITLGDVVCGSVIESRFYKRFTLVQVAIPTMDRTKINTKKWQLFETFQPEYYW